MGTGLCHTSCHLEDYWVWCASYQAFGLYSLAQKLKKNKMHDSQISIIDYLVCVRLEGCTLYVSIVIMGDNIFHFRQLDYYSPLNYFFHFFQNT